MSKRKTVKPVASTSTSAEPPVAPPNGEPHVAIPKSLFEEWMAFMIKQDYKDVEHLLAPVRFGGVAREVTFQPAKPKD